MRGRKRLGALLVVLADLLACGWFLYAAGRASVTREDYDRIRPGMTDDEVLAALGPPGDYRNGPTEDDDSPSHKPAFFFREPIRSRPALPKCFPPRVFLEEDTFFGTPSRPGWRTDKADVLIGFDAGEDGLPRVCDRIFYYKRPKGEGRLGNALWRAERRWRHALGVPPFP